MDSIIQAKEFDIKHVRLGKLRTLDNGGKIVYVEYKGKPLLVQTPKLKAPFGLSNWEGKYSIDLSLAGYDGSNESAAAFFKALSALDDFMLEEGMQNGMAWFKRKMPNKDVVDALYTRNVKFAKDKNTGEITDKYPPTFKIAVPHRDGQFQCDVFDVKREKVNLAEVEAKGAKVSAIAQCLGIWVAGGKFGCSWKVVQLRIEPQAGINGYAFRDLDDGEGLDVGSDIDDHDHEQQAPVQKNDTQVDTSDDDEPATEGGAADVATGDDDLEKIGGGDAAGEPAASQDDDAAVATAEADGGAKPARGGRAKATKAK